MGHKYAAIDLRKFSKIATPFLAFIMLFGIMRNNLLYVIYEYDTALFISLFCENQNKPQLKCNGKCKLAKMLKEQKEEEAAKVLKQLQTEVLYYPQPVFTYPSRPEKFEEVKRKHPLSNQSLYSFLFTMRNDKPPEYFTSI
ncbi:hypothetical protein ACR78Z_03990 [Sphingobacterium thalpophilum]|uniref:Uncharacterized protein n=4 Tax=Bacteroidota TaxID=976 RepID=A0A4U9VK42_9SPHI|nr:MULTISPECIES: hypothetical protein [Bacteroidota]MCT3745493.1 hypothetical protein [Elizabethkingia anophelis]VTR46527.1 Uncharacterised protein [Sphingobacterium thalpophilum]